MSLRFRRSIKLLPGVRINLGKTGASLSLGSRGASITVGKRGVYSNVGMPGTGISWRTKAIGSGKTKYQTKRLSAPQNSQLPSPGPISQKVQFILKDDGTIRMLDEWGNPASQKIVKMAREQGADQLQEWLEQQCEKINEGIDLILNCHLYTPAPANEIRFEREQFPKEKPEKVDFNEPSPQEPRLKKIGLLAKIFSWWRKRVDRKNLLAQEKYHSELKNWEDRKLAVRNQYEQELQEWREQKDFFDAEQDRFREMVEHGIYEDSNIMRDFLNSSLSEIPWPRETEIAFDILEDGKKLILDVDLPEIEMLPKKKASIAGRGLRLYIKEKSETEKRKDYMRLVHAINFRIIGTVFATLPLVDVVVISAYSQRANPATGAIGDEYLLSARINRSQWEKINFHNLITLDPTCCFEGFDLNER